MSACHQTYLTSLRLGVLLLDLHLTDIARMLNDLGDVRLVASTNLTRDTLAQIRKSSVHPVLPENTDTIAEGRKVRLDHAERTVDGPEQEEDGEEVVRVPEALELGSSLLLGCSPCHGCERSQHDVASPSRACCEVGKKEADEAELVGLGKHPQISPMRNRVNPGEEEDGPPDQLVESNVLVERNDAVERCPSDHRY
jgi:hypothetical protein